MSLPRRISGIGLFALGLLISLTLTVVALWPDFEADFYGFTQTTNVHLKGLRCPSLMGADEHPLITLRLTNTNAFKTTIPTRAVVSSSGLTTQEYKQLILFQPGQTQTISWPLNAENAVFHNFILAKVYMRGAYPMPAAESTCGVYVLNLSGVSGAAVYWTLFAVGVASLLAGVFLLEPPASPPLPDGGESAAAAPQRGSLASARRGLALVTVIGLYVSYIGLWIMAMLCLVVIVLILLGMLLIVANR